MTPMQRSAVLVGAPFDNASSFLQGPSEAPPLIRDALYSPAGNLYSEDGTDLSADGLLRDLGDLTFDSEAAVRDTIREEVARHVADDNVPLLLGGDHSITWPAVQAVAARYPELSILHVDAHPDLYDTFEGNPLSHATPFARIMEAGLVRELVQVGIRAATLHQRDQAARFGVRMLEMRNLERPITTSLKAPVYLSLDVDSLDPAFAPGVSHPEPGGLSVRDVLDLIASLRGMLVAADLVEYNPRVDERRRTAVVCAKLLKEMVAAAVAPTSW